MDDQRATTPDHSIYTTQLQLSLRGRRHDAIFRYSSLGAQSLGRPQEREGLIPSRGGRHPYKRLFDAHVPSCARPLTARPGGTVASPSKSFLSKRSRKTEKTKALRRRPPNFESLDLIYRSAGRQRKINADRVPRMVGECVRVRTYRQVGLVGLSESLMHVPTASTESPTPRLRSRTTHAAIKRQALGL